MDNLVGVRKNSDGVIFFEYNGIAQIFGDMRREKHMENSRMLLYNS